MGLPLGRCSTCSGLDWWSQPTLPVERLHWWSSGHGGGSCCTASASSSVLFPRNTHQFVIGCGWFLECWTDGFWVLSGFESCVLRRSAYFISFVIAAFSLKVFWAPPWLRRVLVSGLVFNTPFTQDCSQGPVKWAENWVVLKRYKNWDDCVLRILAWPLLVVKIHTTQLNTSSLVTFLV